MINKLKGDENRGHYATYDARRQKNPSAISPLRSTASEKLGDSTTLSGLQNVFPVASLLIEMRRNGRER